MSTASVSGSVRPPSINNAQRPQSTTQPTPEDAQAMRDALASARERSGREGAPAQMVRQQPKAEIAGQPKAAPPKTMPGKQDEAQVAFGHALRQQAPGRDPLSADREASRDAGNHSHNDAIGVGQQQAGPPPVTVTAPPLPPSHVDAAAFAQLMTRLWNRESAKGTKEVHVEFGDATWPATGARLVRNAAGTLDVQLFTADRGATDQNLDELRERFAENGIEVGALAVSES